MSEQTQQIGLSKERARKCGGRGAQHNKLLYFLNSSQISARAEGNCSCCFSNIKARGVVFHCPSHKFSFLCLLFCLYEVHPDFVLFCCAVSANAELAHMHVHTLTSRVSSPLKTGQITS